MDFHRFICQMKIPLFDQYEIKSAGDKIEQKLINNLNISKKQATVIFGIILQK